MGVKIPAGTANPSLPIYCRALTGAALTGKVAADFTALWYMREGGAKVDVDPAGITEVAGGEYRQTFPTAAAAIGANYVTIGGEVSGGVVLGIPIELDTSTTPGGIYTQTVTVKTAGAVAIPNATVQIWSGDTLVSTKTTNALGVASPQSNAGTFTLKVACPGYNDYSAALTVAGNATLGVITLSAHASAPSTEPNTVTVRWRVKKTNRTWVGLGEATVYIQILEGPGTAGIIWHGDNDDFDSKATDASGYVEFTNVPVPCTLGVMTGTGRQLKTVSIPEGADAEDVYDAGELISLDA